MDSSESPPTMQEMALLNPFKVPAKAVNATFMFLLTEYFPPKSVNQPRNCDQHGDTLPVNGIPQLGRFQRVCQDDRPFQKRRNEKSQHLAKDVAQREKIEET